MLQAVLELSSESEQKFTARDVHDRMRALDVATTEDFNSARMAHGKSEIIAEYPLLKFSGRYSYRVTPESLAQLGKKAKKKQIRKSKKSP